MNSIDELIEYIADDARQSGAFLEDSNHSELDKSYMKGKYQALVKIWVNAIRLKENMEEANENNIRI